MNPYPKLHSDYMRDCIAHMHEKGISFDGCLKPDGELHRFSRDSKKNQPDEWYICHEGVSVKGTPYLVCSYGSWSGNQEKFIYTSYDENHTISYEERIEIQLKEEQRKKQIESQLNEDKKKRIKQAQEAWEQTIQNPTSSRQTSYLERKQVNAYGVKYGFDLQCQPVLVVPLCNSDGELQAIQYIHEDGTKRIHGIKKGNFHVLGTIKEDNQIFIVEGYATGASIHQATGKPVIIAFDCGNLKAVVQILKNKYPKAKITIAADDDSETPGNPGKTKAEEAAKAYSCEMITPIFPKDLVLPLNKTLTDFNDLHVHVGIDEVKKQLEKKKNHLTVLSIVDFVALKLPPRKLLLDPWLAEQGLAMIYAKRGIGKTYFALNVAYAIASGGKFLKWKATTSKRVLYVDGEMPASLMQERLLGIQKTFNTHIPDPSFFKIITPDLQSQGIRDLSTTYGQQDLNEFSEAFDVIILDNLSTLVRSGSENESESWLPIQEWALYLRRLGKTVIFVHHAGKGGQQRGTSRKEDVLDTVITLKHPKDYSPQDGARFEVHFEKSRGFCTEALPFEACLSTNENGIQVWKIKDTATTDMDLVADLYNSGIKNQRKIAAELGKSVGFVNKQINDARAKGKIDSDS